MNYEIVSDKTRAEFRRAQDFMALRAPNVDFIIQPYTMIVEVLLDAAKDSYKLDFYQSNTNSLRPSENRVNRNDLLFANRFAISVYKQDVTASLDNYSYPKFTYPDTNYFNGNDTVNLPEWQALMTIWDGRMDLVTDPVKRVEEISLIDNLYTPERQVLEGDYVGITNETLPQWGERSSQKGYREFGFSYIIDGSENNHANIFLGTGNRTQIAGLVDSANAPVTTRNVLRLSMQGFKVNNGAQKVGRWTQV